jgi:hypothetical protein
MVKTVCCFTVCNDLLSVMTCGEWSYGSHVIMSADISAPTCCFPAAVAALGASPLAVCALVGPAPRTRHQVQSHGHAGRLKAATTSHELGFSSLSVCQCDDYSIFCQCVSVMITASFVGSDMQMMGVFVDVWMMCYEHFCWAGIS